LFCFFVLPDDSPELNLGDAQTDESQVDRAQIDEAQVEAALKQLETALGHAFSNEALLLRALTHRSLANQLAHHSSAKETAPTPAVAGDNERLEFLGDAVLNLVVAEALFESHPEWQEGELTRVRAQLVSRQFMAGVAEAIDLGQHLRLSRGEERSGLRLKSTVLSNTMEAVVGAVFLDGGLEPVRAFVRRRVIGEAAEQLAEELRCGAALGNYKSALQERLQATRAGKPVYRVKSETGPDHKKRFLVEVRIQEEAGAAGQPLARGLGTTKKRAEQDAARQALERLAVQGDLDAAGRAEPGPEPDPDPDADPEPDLEEEEHAAP
jgi:ribonuclease-3